MTRTIMAVYESFYTASQAVRDLRMIGVSGDMIDVFTRSNHPKAADVPVLLKSGAIRSEIPSSGMRSGAQVGATIGSAAGITTGVLVALGTLYLPGLGAGLPAAAVMAAAVTAVGVLIGGATGSALGLRIPDQEIRQYARNVQDGQVVVTILANWNLVDPVIQMLNKHNPLEVREKATAHSLYTRSTSSPRLKPVDMQPGEQHNHD